MEIECQQLKYLILNDNITPREVQTAVHQFEKQLLNQEYMVCCCERTADEAERNNGCLFLGEIEESNVYIVGRESKEFLLKNDLRDFHTGVSGVHCGVADVKTAYREAKARGSRRFCACGTRCSTVRSSIMWRRALRFRTTPCSVEKRPYREDRWRTGCARSRR